MAGRQIDDINVFPAMSRRVWRCLIPRITPQGLQPVNKNAGKHEESVAGGPPGGPLPPDSDQYNAFRQRLKASGFTGEQLILIDDALRQCGLKISEHDQNT